MIGDATFYLGAVSGTKLESSTYFYFDSTEKIYGEERGTTLCGACNNDITKLTWTGKIGLMYPSDVYMTYANGVNDICYNDPSMCGMNNNNQRSSWLHYTCRFPNDGSESTIYLMSPYAGRSDWVTARLDWGFLYVSSLKGHYLSSTYYTTNGVRPVVYLSADVQIFDGDGSRGNPYKLKK